MKKWYKSKTMWYNIGVSMVAVGNELMPLLQIMEPDTAAEVRVFLIAALSIGNAILRVVSNTKVTL